VDNHNIWHFKEADVWLLAKNGLSFMAEYTYLRFCHKYQSANFSKSRSFQEKLGLCNKKELLSDDYSSV